MIIGTAVWRQQNNAERAKSTGAISEPALTPQPTPTSVPTPQLSPYHDCPSYLAAQQQRAPRAALVKLPPPQAQLISLPDWKVGETRPVTMPYNLEVLATYLQGATRIRKDVTLERQCARRHVGCRRDALGVDLGSRRSTSRLDRSLTSASATTRPKSLHEELCSPLNCLGDHAILGAPRPRARLIEQMPS